MIKGGISSSFTVKSSDEKNVTVSGYASVFGIPDRHNDIIIGGAFKSPTAASIKLLWQHDVTKPIGIITECYEDGYGLKIIAEINNRISTGREAAELIKQQAVGGLSIGFTIKAYDYDLQGRRIISDAELMEVSIVTFPANPEAQIKQVKNYNPAAGGNNKGITSLDLLEAAVKQLRNY